MATYLTPPPNPNMTGATNGPNWRTVTATSGSTVEAGCSTDNGTGTVTPGTNAVTYDPGTDTYTFRGSAGTSSTLTAQDLLSCGGPTHTSSMGYNQQAQGHVMTGHYLKLACTAQQRVFPDLEDAGITAGEIMAWRCWWVDEDFMLRSMNLDTTWMPGEPMTGRGVDDYSGIGVHAFKTLDQAKREYDQFRSHYAIVFGTVSLWGIVIEHELGYRAEYAQPEELVSFWPAAYKQSARHPLKKPLFRNNERWTAEILARLKEKYERPK